MIFPVCAGTVRSLTNTNAHTNGISVILPLEVACATYEAHRIL